VVLKSVATMRWTVPVSSLVEVLPLDVVDALLLELVELEELELVVVVVTPAVVGAAPVPGGGHHPASGAHELMSRG
jgi:hypothetical protein